jgi:hypothetical protein
LKFKFSNIYFPNPLLKSHVSFFPLLHNINREYKLCAHYKAIIFYCWKIGTSFQLKSNTRIYKTLHTSSSIFNFAFKHFLVRVNQLFMLVYSISKRVISRKEHEFVIMCVQTSNWSPNIFFAYTCKNNSVKLCIKSMEVSFLSILANHSFLYN